MLRFSYATYVAALEAHATTADDAAAVATLPTVDPSGGAGISLSVAYARILGLAPAATSTTAIDVSVTLNSTVGYTFGNDAVYSLEHEISEGGLGRIGGLGFQNSRWGPLDLFRYSAPGVRDYTAGQDGLATYFSVDGTNLLTQFHSSVNAAGVFDGYDVGDWNNSSPDSFSTVNNSGPVTATDLRLLDILGWTPTLPDDYANNLTDTARRFGQVAIGGSTTGNLEVSGDRDWFRVRLEAGTSYTLDLSGTSLHDPYLRLHDSTGAVLAENNDISISNPNSEIVFTPTATGSYFLEAGAFNDATTGTYTVAVAGAAPRITGTSGGRRPERRWQVRPAMAALRWPDRRLEHERRHHCRRGHRLLARQLLEAARHRRLQR